MQRIILILLVSLLLAACAPAQPSAPADQSPSNASIPVADISDLARTDSQGMVTVKTTPLNLEKAGDTLNFDVVMDTHSVELSMDLTTIASLTTDTGLTIQASKWDAPSGGHHAEGTLSFPAMKDGKPILDGAKKLTMTITGIDNATRTFSWELSTN